MSRQTFIRQAFLVGFVVLALGAGLASSSSGRAASSASCVATSLKYTYAGRSTTKYGIAAVGVSCSFAKAWVPRLVPKIPVKGTGYAVFTIPGPPGWRCNAYDPRGGTAKPKRAYAGACVPSTPTRKKFAWQPVS
jgi:hypothetical protein